MSGDCVVLERTLLDFLLRRPLSIVLNIENALEFRKKPDVFQTASGIRYHPYSVGVVGFAWLSDSCFTPEPEPLLPTV